MTDNGHGEVNMAYLLQLKGDPPEWDRTELPPGGVLLSIGDNPGCAVALTRWGEDAGLPDHGAPGLVEGFAPAVGSGRKLYVHINLAAEAYRNDEPLSVADLVVLRAGDCLSYAVDVAVQRVFFDAFTRPQVRPYGGDPVPCPFCRQPVNGGVPAVQCPGCGVAFHQPDEDGCWLAADHCPNCGHPTALDQAPAWVPRGFERGIRGRRGLRGMGMRKTDAR